MSAELPLASASDRGDVMVAGPGSGSDGPVRALLMQLVELWKKDCCPSAPLHLLFAPMTVAAVLNAGDSEVTLSETTFVLPAGPRRNILFFVFF